MSTFLLTIVIACIFAVMAINFYLIRAKQDLLRQIRDLLLLIDSHEAKAARTKQHTYALMDSNTNLRAALDKSERRVIMLERELEPFKAPPSY